MRTDAFNYNMRQFCFSFLAVCPRFCLMRLCFRILLFHQIHVCATKCINMVWVRFSWALTFFEVSANALPIFHGLSFLGSVEQSIFAFSSSKNRVENKSRVSILYILLRCSCHFRFEKLFATAKKPQENTSWPCSHEENTKIRGRNPTPSFSFPFYLRP